MPKLDLASVPALSRSGYPAPHAAGMAGRSWQAPGEAGGLTQFGVNLVILAPGAKSSLRHWHPAEDEFVMVTMGHLILIEDAGETEMGPGDCAAFPAGVPDGHHLLNRSGAEARFLVAGTRTAEGVCVYSDVDMMVRDVDGKGIFTRRDGSPL